MVLIKPDKVTLAELKKNNFFTKLYQIVECTYLAWVRPLVAVKNRNSKNRGYFRKLTYFGLFSPKFGSKMVLARNIEHDASQNFLNRSRSIMSKSRGDSRSKQCDYRVCCLKKYLRTVAAWIRVPPQGHTGTLPRESRLELPRKAEPNLDS